MKIGLITGEYPPMQGGVGAFTQELAAALADLGHETHVITRVGCEEGAKNFDVHPVAPNWGWRSCGRVPKLARKLGLDVLNVQYQAAAYDLHPAINFLTRRTRRQCTVVTFHDLKVPYLFPKAGPLRNRAVTMLALHADAAIVTNRADELALNSRQVGRVARIPIGSNIALALPDNYDRQAWRSQLKLTASDILLGFFGFFNQRKGVETLVRALAILPRNHHLLFIGGTVGSSDATNKAYAEHISALIAQLGLESRVHYTGYAPASEVSAAFTASDLCALPFADGISFHHGTLMAALAHKRPIVSTAPSVNLPELVHGENVWLVPPQDYSALAAAVTTLASNPERRQHLAQGASKLAAQFKWSHIAARTAELFNKLKG